MGMTNENTEMAAIDQSEAGKVSHIAGHCQGRSI